MSILGYQNYSPNERGKTILEAAFNVCAEYKAWESPLTVRQVFYRLVAEYSYDKTEQAYGSLVNYIARSRRARQGKLIELTSSGLTSKEANERLFEERTLIPFSWIRDEKGQSIEMPFYEGEGDFIEHVKSAAENMKLDRQEDQPQIIEMWCEAAGMVPLLTEIAEPYGIRVSSGGGYDSVTAKHQLAQRVVKRIVNGRIPTIVLHIGDFDPSGEGMYESLRDDVSEMVADFGGGCDMITVERVALTERQVIEMNVETAPPKPMDSRRRGFIERHPDIREHLGSNNITAQLEALRPPELTDLLEKAVERYIDEAAYEDVLGRESIIREELARRLELR